MTKIISLLSFVFLFSLAGCAHRPVELVELPLRDADLYPNSFTNGSITVAVDEIRDPERSLRYFGADFTKTGLVPVNIVISNYGKTQYKIHPANVLLRRGNQIIDPVPVKVVAEIAKHSSGRMRPRTEEQIDDYFSTISFSETVLNPYDSYQGVLFFRMSTERKEDDRFFRTVSLFMEGRARLNFVLSDRNTSRRLHFGPFSLNH